MFTLGKSRLQKAETAAIFIVSLLLLATLADLTVKERLLAFCMVNVSTFSPQVLKIRTICSPADKPVKVIVSIAAANTSEPLFN